MTSFGRWTPRASARTRLLLAAITWTAVGAGLCWVGTAWIAVAEGALRWGLLAAAVAVGLLKARVVLAGVAGANARRIAAAGDGYCLWGYLTWRAWLFVGAMMLFGATLRRLPLARPWLGSVYLAAGTALIAGSIVSWRFWSRHRPRRSPGPPA
ncbi:MAG TPA: hypothetical protein VD788_01680 [Candidatus Polarisedimenticolaceae bacterium]|nr:hypothetical protein [Candidatus Polarisedimenticolaceae bacterium]